MERKHFEAGFFQFDLGPVNVVVAVDDLLGQGRLGRADLSSGVLSRASTT